MNLKKYKIVSAKYKGEIMSIEWHRIDKIEIDLINLSLTLMTKEGFVIAQSNYNSRDEVMENSAKCWRNIMRSKGVTV